MVPYTGATTLPGKHAWPNATPGRILRSLIDNAKTVDGWAPGLTVDFTPTADSAGAAWTDAERWSPEFTDLVTLRSVLEAHASNGLIDWWTEGQKLRVFRPGSGAALPNVKLGGAGFSRMPTKRAYDGQFSNLTVICDDGGKYYLNPGADTSFGIRHQVATLSGVKLADADRIVQPMLEDARTLRQELSYEWTPVEGLPVPWVSFQVGDGVKCRTRDGWIDQRVLGVTVAKASGQLTVRATVGSKLMNRLKQAMDKVNAGSLGGLVGGTGTVIPAAPPAQTAPPMSPTGLHVESNTATWGTDGRALTRVQVAWDAVTQNTDLASLDGVLYEVWAHTASTTAARLTKTDALSFTMEGWEPGTARYVTVRAVDRTGRVGEFSSEIAVVPVTPASIIPVAPVWPADPVVSNTAAFLPDGRSVAQVTVGWEPVTASTDGGPVTVAEYEVTYGLETARVRTPQVTVTIPTGVMVAVTVRALSDLRVWGDSSAPVEVTGAAPSVVAVVPSTPLLAGGMGAVAYRWDGLTATGGLMPAGFARVVVDTAPDDAGPWTAEGATLAAAGGSTVTGQPGDQVHARFRAFDTLGRLMGTSSIASETATGVPLSGLDPAIQDAILHAQTTADGKNRVFAQTTEPAAEAVGDQWWVLDDTGTSIIGVQVWDGTAWVPYLMLADTIVAAGSITSPLMAAGSIQVDHLAPNVGETLVIDGNVSILALGDRADAADAGIAQVGQDVAGAQSTADGAQAAADGAAAAADDVADRLTQHQLVFRVEPDAVKIGRPDGSSELRLAPEGIEMVQQGVTVSKWIGGVLIADETRLKASSIASHRIEALGSQRTVFRPL
ncbi:hypothetical protein [Microbacterium sp.]|uniref:hypothetical protein n=1 Tax=Microbacterium sp. TaxID=51671 RepID=UPI003A8D2900